jgi:hypothetical protein
MLNNKNLLIWKWYEFLFEKDWEKFKLQIQQIYDHPPVDRYSIKYCWEQFRKNQFRLKIDINKFYEMLGVDIVESDPKIQPPVLKLTQQNHMCIVEPKDDSKLCQTNPYYKYNLTSVHINNRGFL